MFSLGPPAACSDWKLDDALALLERDVVSVQEVAVETGLEAATEDLCQAVLAVELVSVDPVEDVEESVHAEGSHVVRGYVLDDPDLVEHDDLRDESECFEPKAETPLELKPPLVVTERVILGGVCCVANQGQNQISWHQGLEVWEIIAKLIVSLSNKTDWISSLSINQSLLRKWVIYLPSSRAS